MIDPTLVAAFRDVFKARPIDVHADGCLSLRHKDAGCQRCTDACPTQAITLSGGYPQLDESHCVNCGACLRVCPTDVYAHPLSPETALLHTHIELPLQPMGLICPVHQSPEKSHLPVQKVVRHKRCLVGFSPEHLLTLAADGERPLWLDDSYCGRCPIGHAHKTITQAAATANRLLVVCGRPASIHLRHDVSDTLDDAHPVHILESGQSELSRRGLFRMLGGRVQQQTADVLDYLPDPKPVGPVPVAQRLPQHIPTSRQRLNEHLTGLAPLSLDLPGDFAIPTGDVPYGNVLIDEDACTACDLCTRFCPSGALRFNEHEPDQEKPGDHGAFELSFRPDLCLDCNICVVACPEEAVSMGAEIAALALAGTTWETRVTGQLVECGQCGTPTRLGDEGETTRCSVCRRGGRGVHRQRQFPSSANPGFRG